MRLDGAVAAKLAQPAVADGGVAMATVLIVPADEAVAAGVRALAGRFRGEVGVSAWNGFAVYGCAPQMAPCSGTTSSPCSRPCTRDRCRGCG